MDRRGSTTAKGLGVPPRRPRALDAEADPPPVSYNQYRLESGASSTEYADYLWEKQLKPLSIEVAVDSSSMLFGPSVYVNKYLCMAAWLALVMLNYFLTLGWAAAGIPSDAATPTGFDVAQDLFKMTQFTLALGWFTDITRPDRFYWLFGSRDRWYFFALFFITPVVYGATSNLPGLQHSVTDIGSWGAFMWVTSIVGLLVVVVVAGGHVILCRQNRSPAEVAVYVGSRALVFVIFAVAAASLAEKNDVHVHHYFIFWSVALLAEFNHPLSAVTLAVAGGIFVQGVGAYDFDPIFTPAAGVVPAAAPAPTPGLPV